MVFASIDDVELSPPPDVLLVLTTSEYERSDWASWQTWFSSRMLAESFTAQVTVECVAVRASVAGGVIVVVVVGAESWPTAWLPGPTLARRNPPSTRSRTNRPARINQSVRLVRLDWSEEEGRGSGEVNEADRIAMVGSA